SDGHYKFKYFPVSALFFSALGWLPLAAAKYIWLLVVSSAVGGLLWISQKLLGADARNTRLAVVLTGLILARFYIRELELGQVNAVIALTLAGATWFMIRSRPCLAGLLIGLAIALKPHALIFLPYLAIRREWRGCLTAIGVLVGAMLLPVLRYGPQGFLDLLVSWKNTVSGSTPALLTNPDNVSIFGAWAKWLGPEPSTSSMIIAGTVLALLGIAAVIYSWRVLTETVPERIRSRALAVEGSILLMLIPLLSPQGWDHVFLAATPGVLILLTSWGQLERWKRWVLGVDLAVIGLTIYD
ncbi:MAG: DUF2029 domain-containing protein, partial [bacterium]|nr:DUF2029 domain-containing protein [bacterium]